MGGRRDLARVPGLARVAPALVVLTGVPSLAQVALTKVLSLT